MFETSDDRKQLQDLMDRSYARAGKHLLSVHEPRWRMTADEVVETVTGMALLVLATTGSDGRPLASPVDGLLVRGEFYFSSSPDSVRARNIARDPRVSAVHTRGEEMAVTVHGSAVPVHPLSAADGFFATAAQNVYGSEWESWGGTAPTWRIIPERVYAFKLRKELLNEAH